MNERIKELAEQAGSTHKQSLGVYQFYTDELEKFAQLIVKECMSNLYLNGYDDAMIQVQQHFGVEEK
jgi:NADH:ubiquinone oxidoreductase subunit E